MEYKEIKDYRILIKGKPEELKKYIKELFYVTGNKGYSEIQEEVENLESMVGPVQFNFSEYHRIYFNKESVLYVPNTSNKETRKFHYEAFNQFFKKAKDNIENYSE